jgi:soluble lytic murein transglycosylase-like protein
MKTACFMLVLFSSCCGWSRSVQASRQEAEYYVTAYALHYRVPLDFVRALIAQESGWQPCAISTKGAAGLMQLMPATAAGLGVTDRCDIQQNVSGGIRHLARLMKKFHGDLRLVAAAYYAGEQVIETRGLDYANRDVVAYVAAVRERTDRQNKLRSAETQRAPRRTR